jgi:hypothetical protein
VTKKRKEEAMQYVLLIYQGTFWGALSDLSQDEKNALVAEYGEINHGPASPPVSRSGFQRTQRPCVCSMGRR